MANPAYPPNISQSPFYQPYAALVGEHPLLQDHTPCTEIEWRSWSRTVRSFPVFPNTKAEAARGQHASAANKASISSSCYSSQDHDQLDDHARYEMLDRFPQLISRANAVHRKSVPESKIRGPNNLDHGPYNILRRSYPGHDAPLSSQILRKDVLPHESSGAKHSAPPVSPTNFNVKRKQAPPSLPRISITEISSDTTNNGVQHPSFHSPQTPTPTTPLPLYTLTDHPSSPTPSYRTTYSSLPPYAPTLAPAPTPEPSFRWPFLSTNPGDYDSLDEDDYERLSPKDVDADLGDEIRQYLTHLGRHPCALERELGHMFRETPSGFKWERGRVNDGRVVEETLRVEWDEARRGRESFVTTGIDAVVVEMVGDVPEGMSALLVGEERDAGDY